MVRGQDRTVLLDEKVYPRMEVAWPMSTAEIGEQ